jgi:hypothetical protein
MAHCHIIYESAAWRTQSCLQAPSSSLVGQPILAAAAFQAALFDRGRPCFRRKRRFPRDRLSLEDSNGRMIEQQNRRVQKIGSSKE